MGEEMPDGAGGGVGEGGAVRRGGRRRGGLGGGDGAERGDQEKRRGGEIEHEISARLAVYLVEQSGGRELLGGVSDGPGGDATPGAGA